MYSRVVITFNTDAVSGDSTKLGYNTGSGQASSIFYDWVSGAPSAGEIQVQTPTGIVGEASAIEYASKVDTDYNNPVILNITQLNNTVTIDLINSVNTWIASISSGSSGDVSFDFEDSNPKVRINVRSPFFEVANIDNNGVVVEPLEALFDIYIYKGIFGTDKPINPTYTYKKKPRFLQDNSIYIDVSRQISDYINSSYDGTLTANTVFVEVHKTTTYTGGLLESQNYYLAFNGYNLHRENVNYTGFDDLMISNTSISVLKGEDINIPFYLGGDDYSIEFRKNTTILQTSTVTSVGINNTNTTVNYITHTEADEVNNVRILNTVTQEEIILDVEVVTECIYESVKVTFINRFGVLQDFFCYKISKETIKTKSNEYNVSVLNETLVNNVPSLVYDPTQHNTITYAKVSNKSIELNTGYMPEDNNVIIEELINSEYVWLTIDNEIKPVNINTKSIKLMTKVNDQLIKYKLKFDFSYSEIQAIR